MDHFAIWVLICFALVGYKSGVVEAEDCNKPYTGNTEKKPTPLDFGFKYVGDKKFENKFYCSDRILETVVMSLTPDGYAEFEVSGRPYPMSSYFESLKMYDSAKEGAKAIYLPAKGWYVPEECAKGERKARSPEDFGFNHVGKGVYIKKYINTNNEEDTIKMRVTAKNVPYFTYHPIRNYFPLERHDGVIELPDRGQTQIPLTGIECGNLPVHLEEHKEYTYKNTFPSTDKNPGDRYDGFKFQHLRDGFYEKEFKTKDHTVEKIRMRFDVNGLAEWNFNESPNIEEDNDGSLSLKLEGGYTQYLGSLGWDKVKYWYVPGKDHFAEITQAELRQSSRTSRARASGRYRY